MKPSISLFLLFTLMSYLPKLGYTQFQRNYGTPQNDSFSKVISDGTNYYVLGQTEPSAGALNRATVTRLDVNGLHQWTLSLDIASVWNDAVMTANGDLLVVGATLPFDATTKSLMGVVTSSGGGNFSCLHSYDEPGRDFFYRIVKNPVPEDVAFPYYILGSQNQAGASATTEDVVLLNVDANCNFKWKKVYTSNDDDEFFRDLEALPNGDLLLAGNDGTGRIFQADNTGNIIGGVQISGIVFNDVGQKNSNSSIFASANGTSGAHVLKFGQGLFPLDWDVIIPQLTTITQVWEGAPGDIYVTGRGTFNGANRAVIIKLLDNGPTIDWVKYLNAGSGFIGGSSWLMASGQLAYTDSRVISGGFGGPCAFMSLSDLNLLDACQVTEDMVSLVFADPIPDSPIPLPIDFWDIPMGANLSHSAIDWLEEEVCTNDPCEITMDINFVDSCGHIQVTTTSAGPQPHSYQWCSGENTPNIDMILPCGAHTFCVTLTCGDGSMSTASQQITVADNIPPTAICVPSFGVELAPNCMYNVTVGMIDGGSFDNCQIQSMSVSPSVLNGCGIFPITLTVEDWCGNISTCMTEIQTIEVVPPSMTCPADLTLHCDDDLDPSSTGSPVVVDNCDPNPVLTYSDVVFGQMPCDGLLQRTWTATDNCGNVSTCTQNILVFDNEAPMIACPPDMTITSSSPSPCEMAVNGIQWLSVTDNCGTPSVNFNISGATVLSGAGDASGTTFNQGVSTVTYTAMDDCGNSTDCSFTVTVECAGMQSLFKCGMAVVTCFSGFSSGNSANPNGPVLAIVDVRNHGTAPLGMNWSAVSSTSTLPNGIFHDPAWSAQNMGQVFGVTIDNNYNIYVSSSTIYGKYLSSPSPAGGFGNVYKINSTTGNIDWTTTLPQDPLDPAGLGDVWYDATFDRLYVSNFYDGKIYMLNPATGAIISPAYKFQGVPGFPFGTPSPGFIARGERVWAVAIKGNTLYFSVWNEDRTRKEANVQNQIWSVQLDPSGAPTGNAVLEKDMPNLLTNIFSSPVSDISFSETGIMLIAERSMNNDFGDAFANAGNQAHAARIIELSGATWASEKIFYVGNASSNHINSSGGIDYGYDSFDPIDSPVPLLCDSMIWGTGDALRFPGYNNIIDQSTLLCGGSNTDYVYGLAGIPQSGNSNQPFPTSEYVKNSSIYIDVDNNLCSGEKIQIGDVDVFKKCIDCPENQQVPCDSLMVTINEEPPGNQCCFSVDIKNNFWPFISKLQIDICTPGIYINTQHIGPGFQFSPSNSNQTINVTHSSGSIPSGVSNDIIQFCYSGNSGPGTFPQTLKFTWYQNVGGTDVATECMDTTYTDCIITDPPNEDPCVTVTPLQVDCDPNNPYEYMLTFKVTNLSSIPSFNAYTVNLYGLPSGFTFSPCVGPTASLNNISIPIPGAPLLPGAMSGNMCVKIISSSPILSPQNICVNAKLIGIEDCCTVDDQFCFTLEPCCDPCENIAITASEMQVDSAECCYSLGVVNNCPYPYFTKIEAEITTPGVTYGYYALNSSLLGFWSLNGSTNTKLCLRPNNGTIPGGTITDLVDFCLDNINNPGQVPQTVVIRWLTPDVNGQDSIACDTILTFECEVVDYKCLIIDSLDITCIPDSSKYQLTFTVTNNSAIPFCATSLDFIQLAPADLIFSPSASYTFPTPLCQNQSQTVSICLFDLNGLPGDGNLVFIPKLSFMDQDTCCYEGEPVEIPLPPCDTCVCSISTMNLSTTGGDNFTVTCNETDPVLWPSLACQSGDVTIAGNIGCTPMNGATLCPPEINWWLSNQNGPIANGSSTSGNFSITFPASQVSAPGNYTFVSTTLCPGALEACPCYVYWVQEPCDPCCTDSIEFFNAAAAVQINGELGDCMIHYDATGLDSCMQISYVWGDSPPVVDGPYSNNTPVWHTYAGPGTYNVCYFIEEVNANDSICWTYEHCEDVTVVCEDCQCEGFDEMFIRTGGAPSLEVYCDSADVALACPAPGNSIEFTGRFQCTGPDCPQTAQVTWELVRLPNTSVSTGTVTAYPYFGISILPTWYAVPGSYELRLTGHCGSQMCTCTIRFSVDCPDPCPCDLVQFEEDVSKGFANINSGASCKACFAPLALNDCDSVSWHIGSTSDPSIGSSYGNNTFCHDFVSSGSYTITMVVTRKRSDGSLCEVFTYSRTVSILCVPSELCIESIFANPDFDQGAIPGGLNSGGMSDGWMGILGDPFVEEGIAETSQDGWTILLATEADSSDVLTTVDPVCLEKGTGTVSLALEFGIKTKGIKSPISIQLLRGDNFSLDSFWNETSCHLLAEIDLSPLDSGEWIEITIPYDLTDWEAVDTCGESSGVNVRPVIYMPCCSSTGSASNPTARRVHLDKFCFDGMVVALEELVRKEVIRIFPNPTNEKITLSFENGSPVESEIQIIDLWGRTLQSMPLPSGQQQHSLSIATLPAGIYFIKVTENGKPIWIDKLIKQ